ncbi:hypothetical protein GCM10010230_23960 [Streptomyces narbonensis]|uniref:hypothetical protein n=1 Tax=Streptomyces narbonensis TaxID=67333 RepID=UPI00167B42DD|nr:hypothetical protein [Streptomyces narbonensis]GGV99009.1 hypothetical protein GCM10010230_23960 [Streptomyces narbonensis]
MFSVVWGVFATALGWIVATDFRGAAHRFHTLSQALMPFGGVGVSAVGVGFFRLLAGVFALVGPVVLVSGLIDVWRGKAGSASVPPVPGWFVVVEAAIVGVVLWRIWRRSGVLRREWNAGNGARRVAVAGLTTSVVTFVVTLGFGWEMWMMLSWLAGAMCGLALLLGNGPSKPSDTGPAPADSSGT